MNSLFVIRPYWHAETWVFDDQAAGLTREPFVLGIDEMITRLTSDIPDAKKGFTLIFSPAPFPQFHATLEWRRQEHGGNWYYCPELDMEGWLCPALFKYFDEAPKAIYARFEAAKK